MSRDERDEYRGDVWYEEWRSGLPEGSISDEQIDDGYYSGQSPDSLVHYEEQRRSEAQAERRRAEEYEEWLLYEAQREYEAQELEENE